MKIECFQKVQVLKCRYCNAGMRWRVSVLEHLHPVKMRTLQTKTISFSMTEGFTLGSAHSHPGIHS